MNLIKCNQDDFFWIRVEGSPSIEELCNTFSVEKHCIIRNNENVDLYDGEMIKIVKDVKNFHIVKPMETLNSISQKYNKSIEELIKQNNLKANRLFVGQRLRIN